MIDAFDLGDKVVLKKPHACGKNLWQIVRVGADIKLKCLHCGRLVMLDRLEFLKRAKKVVPAGKDETC